jgi:outer membrane receptor protein involved in Fe transport
MRVKLLFFALLVGLFVTTFLSPKQTYSQSTGSIGGTITDAADKGPIIGAIVKIEGTNKATESDINGEFTFLNIEPGTYNLVATYAGYQPSKKTGIKVSVDQKSIANFEMINTTTTDTITIVVDRKGIGTDQSGRYITQQTIEQQGIRGINNIVAKTSGVVQDERGGTVNIRGGRTSENLIIVDGIATNNPITGTSSAFVPNSLLSEIAVLTGGFGAEYGNALSGVINVTTKGGTDKYSGSVEVISDIGVDKIFKTTSQGYNLYNLSFGGPLIPTKSLAKVINFYGGVERQYLRVRNPSWIADDLFPDGIIPGFAQKIWSFNGKLNINLQEIKGSKVPINLRLGALVTQDHAQRFVNSYWKLNSFRNPLQKIDNYQFYGRVSHNISSKLFYELQGTYFKSKDELGDAFFMSDWFAYGDTLQVPGLRRQGTVLTPAIETENVFASPNTVFNRYTLYDISYIGGKMDATWAINTKKAGDHEVKFGGEYRYNTLKKIDFAPVATSNNAIDTIINGQIFTAIADPQSLWFGRDVLLNSYGYDIRDQYGRQIVSDEDIKAKHPIVGSFYLRDKIDFKDFNMNLGIRMDYLDVNSIVLKDIRTLIDANGVLLSDNVYEQSKADITFSPRFGFSFPITDKTVFVANYGKFVQLPQLEYLYINRLAFEYFFKNSVQNVAENSSLKPEKLTSYEIGIKQKAGDYLDMGITAYYKETKDQIGITRIAGSSTVPNGYAIYTNTDFSTAKGLDFYLSLRRTNRIAVDIAYTLLYATGVGANPDAKFSLANNPNGVLPKFQFPLDYDQRHTGSINLDYRFGGWNDVPKGFLGHLVKDFGFNLLFSFNSGRPYTARKLPSSPFLDDGEALTTKNQVYRNWNLRFDLKVDKGFSIWKTNWTAYVYVLNLFNNELVNTVYGSTGRPDDNGYLLTPTGNAASDVYKQNFRDRIRNMTNWGTPRQVRFGLKMSF